MADPITFFNNSRSFVQADGTGFSTDSAYNQALLQANTATTQRDYSGSEGTAETQAQADLAAGTLRARADIQASGAGGTIAGFARADIGDSFRVYSPTGPFQWTSATEVGFTIDLTGLVESAGIVGDFNVINGSTFGVNILQPGTLDAYARWLNGESSAFAEWQAGLIDSSFFTLGPDSMTFPGTPEVNAYPAQLAFNFTPDGDFDWVITMIASGNINGDFAASNAFVTADFYNTAEVSYTGPTGTTTYSASGQFPDTQFLGDAPALAVSAPSTLALLLLPLAGFVRLHRRRACQAAMP